MESLLLNELNDQQKAAVTHVKGPSIILAGAGSGKTRVLTSKVQNLIHNHSVNPQSIMMVTFTNKAAAEMKQRVGEKLGFIGTFHSFGVRVLRRYAPFAHLSPEFVIYDREDQEALIKEVIKELELDKKYTPAFFLSRISSAKDELISPAKYSEMFKDFLGKMVGPAYELYQKKLTRNNAVDFDDLIYKVVKLFSTNEDILARYQDQFRYILVDEFQDTNVSQYQLTKLLGNPPSHLGTQASGGQGNVTVVGDFSQSIYSWRGAQIRNLEKFKEDFENTQTFYLEQNYRSTQKILDFAYEVISQNQTHPILKVFTEQGAGEEVVIEELDNEEYEGLFIAAQVENLVTTGVYNYEDFAVLYRINAQSRAIEEAFLHMGIPYVLIGGTRFYERKEVKDVLSYVRLLVNQDDSVAVTRVEKIGKRRYESFRLLYEVLKEKLDSTPTLDVIDAIIEKTRYTELYNGEDADDLARLENIKELRSVAVNFPSVHEFLEQVALVESEYSQNEKKQAGKKGVHLMTLHQAKGLEFPFVFIVGLEEGILPHSRALDDLYELEEERRLFYVGITRARKKLFITHTRKRFFFGRRNYAQISRFLDDKIKVDPVDDW